MLHDGGSPILLLHRTPYRTQTENYQTNCKDGRVIRTCHSLLQKHPYFESLYKDIKVYNPTTNRPSSNKTHQRTLFEGRALLIILAGISYSKGGDKMSQQPIIINNNMTPTRKRFSWFWFIFWCFVFFPVAIAYLILRR